MIEVKNLTKKYGEGESELIVLKGLNFSVEKGEYVSVTGRSGSGKSTLMYQMGLLDRPNEGEIYIANQDVIAMSDKERTKFRLHELGYIFQDYALVPELTALENVIIPLLMQKTDPRKAEKIACQSLERVGLGDRHDHLPSALSGGEQQRVSIARAIAHDPKIIFADEPTANLDSETAQVVLDAFDVLHQQGQTIVMVTHEPEYAKRADRTITLKDGVIIDKIQ